MVIDLIKFDTYIDVFIKAIDNERAELRKSKQVATMLKTIFDGLIVHSYIKLQKIPSIHDNPQELEKFNQKKLRIRSLLLK